MSDEHIIRCPQWYCQEEFPIPYPENLEIDEVREHATLDDFRGQRSFDCPECGEAAVVYQA